MREVSPSTFGILAAYLLPGFVALWGAAVFSDTVRSWLHAPPVAPTVGGFLYVTLASLGAGLTVSTVRWVLLDSLHHATGIPQPDWDFQKLQGTLHAFELLVESHYRYYQFYANMVVSVAFVYAARRLSTTAPAVGIADVGMLAGIALFFVASRDTLRKYYARTVALLH